MGKVDAFLDSLINYDKENIHENCLKAIKPYLDNPEFEPDFIRAKVCRLYFVVIFLRLKCCFITVLGCSWFVCVGC